MHIIIFLFQRMLNFDTVKKGLGIAFPFFQFFLIVHTMQHH